MPILRVMNFNKPKKTIFHNNNNAFTLLEIIIVITIIGIGVITMTPQMMRNTVEQDKTVEFFNKTLKQALKESREQQAPVSIKGFKGSDNLITVSGERTEIPGISTVNNAEINDSNAYGTEYEITVFPNGICDYFKLTFQDGSYVESSPLLLKVNKYDS